MAGSTWVMLIAAVTLGYVIRIASESVRWRPPMVVLQIRRGAYAIWFAPPLVALAVIIAWMIHLT